MVGQTKTLAKVTFSPSVVQQAQIAQNGILGDFIVRYDVNRELSVGDVQVWCGLTLQYMKWIPEDKCSPSYPPVTTNRPGNGGETGELQAWDKSFFEFLLMFFEMGKKVRGNGLHRGRNYTGYTQGNLGIGITALFFIIVNLNLLYK